MSLLPIPIPLSLFYLLFPVAHVFSFIFFKERGCFYFKSKAVVLVVGLGRENLIGIVVVRLYTAHYSENDDDDHHRHHCIF